MDLEAIKTWSAGGKKEVEGQLLPLLRPLSSASIAQSLSHRREWIAGLGNIKNHL